MAADCGHLTMKLGKGLAVALVAGVGVYRLVKALKCVHTEIYGVSVSITSDNCSFGYLVDWLEKNNYIDRLKHTHNSVHSAQEEEGITETKMSRSPAVGTCCVNIRGKNVSITRERVITLYGSTFETITLHTKDADRAFLDDLLEEATALSNTRIADKLTLYTASCNGSWYKFGCPRKLRPLDTVVLNKGVAESLLEDLREFIDSKEWYEERGVPHHRGYLLYGPPGCGKTSLIKALASELGLAICILNLNQKEMSDEILIELMCVIPEKALVLLEDVDALFKKREAETEDEGGSSGGTDKDEARSNAKVTFSGLLNTIDGIVSAEGRILFMTTNHIEKLDSALIRPGRVDRRQFITYPDGDQVHRMFKRFYKGSTDADAEEFVKAVTADKKERSMAEIQGHFMLFKDDHKKATAAIKTAFDQVETFSKN